MHRILQPEGWAAPRGYSNGIAAAGRVVFVSGQVGWNAQCVFESDDLVDQVRQALRNVMAVLHAGDARAEHVTSLTWYFTSREEYLARSEEIGTAYRAIMGKHFPAMAAVVVASLMEARAKVEVQAIAVVPAA